MLLIVVFGIQTDHIIYFEAALIITMLGFVATATLAKFLGRGEVIECTVRPISRNGLRGSRRC